MSGVLGDLGFVLEDGEDVSPLAQPAGAAALCRMLSDGIM